MRRVGLIISFLAFSIVGGCEANNAESGPCIGKVDSGDDFPFAQVWTGNALVNDVRVVRFVVHPQLKNWLGWDDITQPC